LQAAADGARTCSSCANTTAECSRWAYIDRQDRL
jgi:hypothetical protein